MTRSDIEKQIGVALADHAGDDVHTEQLLASATTRGRAIRRRRLALAAGSAVAAVTVAISVAVGIPMAGSPAPGRSEAASPPTSSQRPPVPDAPVPNKREQVALLPPVTGVPTAAERPDVVGSDPSLVHLHVGKVPVSRPGSGYASWSSEPGLESVSLQSNPGVTNNGGQVIVIGSGGVAELARDSAKLSLPVPSGNEPGTVTEQDVVVNGNPGRLTSRVFRDSASQRWLRWQPASGLWAQVSISGSKPEMLLAIAEAVSVDRVTRCAGQVRLGWIPNGARYLTCRQSVGELPHPGQPARVIFGDGRGKQLTAASVTGKFGLTGRPEPNTAVAGKPAFWAPNNFGMLLVYVTDHQLLVIEVSGGYTRRDAVRAAERAALIASDDPADWPADPLS